MKSSNRKGEAATRDAPRGRNATSRTTVAIATRSEELSGSLLARLASERDLVSLPCTFPSSKRLVSWLEEEGADVLLLDERLLDRLVARSVRRLRAKRPGLRVLLLSDHVSSGLAEEILRNRFQGFLLTSRAADTCVKAIRIVSRGELWVPRTLLEELLERWRAAADDSRPEIGADAKLTRREVQVIGYLRRGLANKQIAEALDIREDTVKKHLRNAYAKLGVHRRSQIIANGAPEPPIGR